MSTNEFWPPRTETKHRALLRELRDLNELSQMPAIYTSRELLREVQQDRREILGRLRDLPLAG